MHWLTPGSETRPAPSLTCLTLLASAGAVPGWNDPARSSRFRVIPLDTLEAVERLPMFSQLFRQLGVSLLVDTAGPERVARPA